MSLPFHHGAQRAHEIAAGRSVRDLFEQHVQMVYALCRLNLRDRLEAEDATQQTFLAAYRSLLAGRGPENPPAWLAAIARNECARLRRGRVSTVPIDELEVSGDDVPKEVERREEIEILAAALSELPPSQRDAVVLREFYGLSYAEVSTVLGVSGPAVESLLFKGRKRLQEKLGSLRVASACALVLPDTVRDALAQIMPGFGGAAASGVTIPAAAKLATLAVIVAGGGVTVADTVHRDPARPATSVVAAPEVTKPRPAPARAAPTPPTTRRALHPEAASAVRAPAGRGLQRRSMVDRTPVTSSHEGLRVKQARAQDLNEDEEERENDADEAGAKMEDVSSAREGEADTDELMEDQSDEPDDESADDSSDSDADDTLDD